MRFLTSDLNEEKAANAKLKTVALRKGVNAKALSSGLIEFKVVSAAPQHRGAAVSSSQTGKADLPAHQPCGDGHRQPGQRSADERACDAPLDEEPEHSGEGEHTESAQHGTGGIERGSLPPSPPPLETSLPFATEFVLLYQGRAGAEAPGARERDLRSRLRNDY